MGKFKITLEDGTKLLVTTDDTPARNIPGAPRVEETEQRIAGRTDLLSQAPKTFQEPLSFEKAGSPVRKVTQAAGAGIGGEVFKKIGQTVLQAGGGILQRGEAALANPLLALQRGEPGEVPGDLVKGLTGEKLGEFGDSIRASGFGGPLNEAIAATVGLSATLGIGALASKGKLIKSTNKAGRALKAMKKARERNNSRFFIRKGETLKQSFNEIMDSVKREFGKLYNRQKGIGGNKIAAEESQLAQEFMERLPKETIRRYNRQIGKKSGIELGKRTETGKILTKRGKPFTKSEIIPPQDISEVKALKDLIDDSVPKNVWTGADKATQAEGISMGDVKELADIIARNAGAQKEKLLSLNAKFSKLDKFRIQINSMTTKAKGTGIQKGTTLKGLRKESFVGERKVLEDLVEFTEKTYPEFSKSVGVMFKEIDSFNRFEKIRKITGALGSPANLTRFGIIGALRGAREEFSVGSTALPK